MTIDMQPIHRTPTKFEAIILEMRKIPHLYELSTCDGGDVTVQFDDKRFKEFCYEKPVSQFLMEWEQGIIDRILLYQTAIDNGTHPYWTYNPVIENLYGKNTDGPDTPAPLRKNSRIYFEKEIKKLELQVGPVKFIKISI